MNTAEYNNLNPWTAQLLQKTAQYFSNQQHHAYLVGGAVRNLLFNQPCTDWDIVTEGDAPRLARQLANQLGGCYAHLHNKASRVIVKHEGQETSIDISPLYGNTIEEDLHLRDFTINAIAIRLTNLANYLSNGEQLTPIDPLLGATDLQARCLRAVSDTVFKHDPLRMLRAVRFMMRYHLTIEQHTECMLTRDSSLLPLAASARIHDELYTILKPEGATQRLRFLDNHGLLTALMPEFIPARGMPQPGLHYWDVLEHSLETVSTLEQFATLLQQAPEEIQRSPLNTHRNDLAMLPILLHEAEQQGIFQFEHLIAPPMKLAALLHDIGKPPTYRVDDGGKIHFYHHPQAGIALAQQIMKRLSTSTQDRRLVQQIVAHHMRPGQLSNDIVTERAIRRYFVDLGPAGIKVALLALADHLAMRGPQPLTEAWERHLAAVCLLLTRYIREQKRIHPPRIIQADELMKRLHIEPGPIVGQLLEYIAEAQAEGRVRSKEDALWLAEEKLQQVRDY
jgi:putative nucleotidyltransferase with HDIG domain